MPPRTAPTARQQRLGAELRKLRERAGLSTREAGALLRTDPARISNIEAGRFGVSAERVRTFACNYACADQTLIDALTEMTADRTRHWWDEYQGILPAGLLDLAELEHRATGLRTAQVTHLPGLLQTVDYARLVFRQSIPELPPHEVEHRVSHRIKRQAVLHRELPLPYEALIHEAALRMRFGGPDVTREQLEHIIAASKRANVSVRVIPFAAGIFPGAGQTVLYAQGRVPQLDTVQLDSEHGSTLLYADAQLAKYRTLLKRMETVALDPVESRDFMCDIAANL